MDSLCLGDTDSGTIRTQLLFDGMKEQGRLYKVIIRDVPRVALWEALNMEGQKRNENLL